MLQSLASRAARGASQPLTASSPPIPNYSDLFPPASRPPVPGSSTNPPPPYSFINPHKSSDKTRDVASSPAEFVADGRYFRGGAEPRETDVFIAVMGVTGSGKSTFISHCTDRAVKIGHSLQACTQTVTAYMCRYSADVNVYLIDTPGFDDTTKSDLEVLKEIATWLTDSFRKNIRINGILYLHRISDPRMQGSAMTSLGMFRKLCGPEALKNVILVTTMWEKVDAREAEERVQELTSTDDFWGCMIARGSRVERHTNDRASALRLVRALLNQQGIALKVQEEMVKDGKSLDETDAGIELEGLLARERAKWQRQMEETQAEYRAALEAKDGEWAAMLRKQEDELTDKMHEADRKLQDMRVTMEAMHKERYEKLQKELEQQRDKLQKQLEKQREELQNIHLVSQLTSVPRTRSHPGRNRILEFRSLALRDNYFFFCGPASRECLLPPNIRSQMTSLPAGAQTGIRLVALGVQGNYWIHYHDERGKCNNITHLSNYPGLESAVLYKNTQQLGCPKTVSLGVGGKYFVNFRNSSDRTLHNLPPEATAQTDFDIAKVKAVWFGARETFVMMRTDRQVRWSAKLSSEPQLYPGLVDQIMSAMVGEPRIKALAMNLTNPKCYAIAWRDGRVHYNSAGVFDGFLFEEFATRNFGTTFIDNRQG